MNEKPEGTPNPLNPNPDAPTEAAPAEATPAPAEPAAAPEEKAPEEKPAAEAKPAETTPTPVAEPVAKSEKPAGKKTGLIVGLIILLLALVGGGVAAALLLGGGNNGGGDVTKAIVKLLSGDHSKKVTTKGTITVSLDNDEIPFDTIGANINIGYDAENQTSSGTIDATVSFLSGSKPMIGLEEQFVNKTLYLKASDKSPAPATNCANDAESTDNCAQPTDEASMISAALSMLGDKWISIPVEEMAKSADLPTGNATQCLLESVTKGDEIDLAGIYKENEFVKYTTEGVTVGMEKYPVYKLTFDADKLAGFANAFGKKVENSSAVAKCFNGNVTADEVSADDLKESLGMIPPIYVEVNENNDFTRLDTTLALDDYGLEVKVKLGFDYSANVNASAPADAIDIQTLLSGFGGGINFDDDDYDYDDDDWDEDDWDEDDWDW